MGVCDDQVKWFEGNKVAEQFLKHFEKFWGHNGDTEQIENAEELFLNKLNKKEYDFMVRDITDVEIKEAIFGIGDEKAPEFFKSNKLLGEVNATLITLVPKIKQPNKDSDYRPIAFRLSNYIVDKKEFLEVVNKEWKCDSEGYKIYKLVKQMKSMKSPLNKLAWKDGNLVQKVKNLEEDLKKAQVEVEANTNNKE
nr:hypothetical protein [Tanacetum cinerariifolium]